MQVGFVLLFSLLCGLSWALGWGVSLGAGEWLWAIKKKKCRLSTGRSGGAFQIEVRAHDQRRSLEEKARRGVGGGDGFDDEYACTYIQGYMGVVSVWRRRA